MKAKIFAVAAVAAVSVGAGAAQPVYLDTSRSFEERAADLVSRMTLQEKIDQLGRNTKAVPRLGVDRYDFWNEALHGIQNGTGEGTSFPMPLSLSVTWDEKFIRAVASAIADECRGHNQPLDEGGRGRGLTYWCPTINLARHPLWGRTNEAWGEDPLVAGMLSGAFVEGMKGDDAKYLKTVPTIKHYALNNHENQRGSTSSDASEADIRDYYARVYRYVVARTDVPSLMSAYNAVNFTPSSANPFLLTTLLRETFGFTGFVVSDCGAIDNIERQQRWVPTRNTVQRNNFRTRAGKGVRDYVGEDGVVTKPGSVAMALMAGCDMDCNGDIYPKHAGKAVEQGLLDEAQINRNVYLSLLSRFRLGEFDPTDAVAYRSADYGFAATVETREHRALAEEAAARSVVLLKNEGGVLPLDAKKLKKVVVVGDMADECFLGNYHGKPKLRNRISVFAGIDDYLFAHNRAAEVRLVSSFGPGGALKKADKALISAADVVIFVAGDHHDDSSEGKDREALTLTRGQDETIRQVAALNRNTILFLQTSNVVELGGFKDLVPAIFWSSQNGQAQGVGVARQLFGETNPCGKLTFTWYAKESELPGIRQYGMKEKFLPEERDYPCGGYTYRYFRGKVDYPFGYGLSYTTFAYSNPRFEKTSADANESVAVSVDVTNTGRRAGSEVVQVYVAYPRGKGLPAKEIKAFAKVDLAPGETKTATMKVDVSDCCFWDGTRRVVPNGDWRIEIAASAEDVRFASPLRVTGCLADALNVVTARPSDLVVKAGGEVSTAVTLTLKDDSFLDPAKAQLAFASSRPDVASVDAIGVVKGVADGVATITVTASYNGSKKSAAFPVAVVGAGHFDSVALPARGPRTGKARRKAAPAPSVDRDALEEAIRVRVSGNDYDPETMKAYEAGLQKARAVFFDAAATQADVDAACRALLGVKAKLRDFRYVVANFPGANRSYGFNAGRSIWVNWANAKNDLMQNTEADFTTHDPAKLELRFRLTLTPSDYETPFSKALAGGSFIKLRSVNVAQKDNDPDLQVFGGKMSENDEHNYGWDVAEFVKDWGVTEIAIPLVTKNPDGTMGLPFIDKGFRADGKSRSSRGKIDWSRIDRFFMNLNFTDTFKNSASVTAKLEGVRVVDRTLEEARERLQAVLDEKVTGGCGCPIKEAAYSDAQKRACAALASESVLGIRAAVKDVREARQALGGKVVADKSKLQELLAARVRDYARYTPESVAAYKAVAKAAARVWLDKKAKQFDVNRAVRSFAGAKDILKLIRVPPRPLATLLDGERSVEAHHLCVSLPAELDLTGYADYRVIVRYEVKFETTHATRPKDAGWLKLVVNGKARVWGEGTVKNETAIDLAPLNCAKDSALAAYAKPGTWMTLVHEVPVAKLPGAKLARFEAYLFNDTGKYAPEPSDGIAWNNDTGVKMTVRNVQVLTDRPAR